MATREQHTFCRICEPLCGLIATVDDGVLVHVRPDRAHVHSKGFMCTKAPAMVEVTYDDDRVLTPLKRVGGPGQFEPVSWDDAMEDITHRLRRARHEHGTDSVATFWGNPPAFSYATMLMLSGFQDALDVKWRYNINSEDAASRTVANLMLRPSFWVTDAVIPARGQTRPEWQILDEIVKRQGLGGAYPSAPLRWLARAGLRPSPRQMFDLLLRTSSIGDWFGLRRTGTSYKKLARREPSGRIVRDDLPVPPPGTKLRTPNQKVRLDLPELRAELDRLATSSIDPSYPLRVLGMREVRSHNSWMHNPERLMPDSRRHTVLVNPLDANAAGLVQGDLATLVSRAGSIEVDVTVSADMTQGNIAVPHAWGHAGGWQRANRAGGATSNVLASARPEDLETLAGMTVLSGIPVRLERSKT